MFERVDCVRLHVDDLDAGVGYYCGKLGLRVAWRMDHAVGFLMGDGKTEVVIQNFDERVETDVKVASVDDAARRIAGAGGRVVLGPFDIEIGKCAVVEDPWGNRMTILDSTKGQFVTDAAGNVVGLA
jgi:Predicted ring-cleavage extradiol dioxygenase